MTTGSAAEWTGPRWPNAAPHQGLVADERPLIPELDPFYRAPAGFEDAEPGTVLRSRDVRLAFLGLVPQQLAAAQLLYRTLDMHGHPAVAVTTVIAPAERDSARPCPILSYQCAIDAVSGRCFPSYALRRGARAFGAFAQLEFLLIAAALSEGWAVSIPDHEGAQGFWGTPREPGYVILDGLRAALNVEGLGLSREAPVGMWGYSGGGLATAWAAENYADHAPELNLRGAVLGSPVADLGSAFRRLNGTLYSGLPALVVAALTGVYPDLNRIVEKHTTPEGKLMLRRIRRMTTLPAVLWMARKDMDRFVDVPLEELLATQEVQAVFDGIKLGTAVPTPPLLFVQAVHDRIISVHDIDALVDTYVRGGADVTYHRDGLSEHLLLHALSAPMSLRWLRDRFAGRSAAANRARTKWPTLLNPTTYPGMARLALICLKVCTGRRLDRRPLSALHR